MGKYVTIEMTMELFEDEKNTIVCCNLKWQNIDRFTQSKSQCVKKQKQKQTNKEKETVLKVA